MMMLAVSRQCWGCPNKISAESIVKFQIYTHLCFEPKVQNEIDQKLNIFNLSDVGSI